MTKLPNLKDGFYLELRNRGSSTSILIRRENMIEIDLATEEYEKTKAVTYLGQLKFGQWIDTKKEG